MGRKPDLDWLKLKQVVMPAQVRKRRGCRLHWRRGGVEKERPLIGALAAAAAGWLAMVPIVAIVVCCGIPLLLVLLQSRDEGPLKQR